MARPFRPRPNPTTDMDGEAAVTLAAASSVAYATAFSK